MRGDYEIVLIKETYTSDNIGNQIPSEIRTPVLCDKKSIGRTEFYSAAANDLKPEIIFVIHPYEYSEEKNIEFENERYKVIRTFSKDFEEMELTCEKVIGNG